MLTFHFRYYKNDRNKPLYIVTKQGIKGFAWGKTIELALKYWYKNNI